MEINQYESLKLRVIDDAPDLLPGKEILVSGHPAETIRIFAAMADGKWAFGYQVNWANGQNSYRNPSFCLGVFRTERDAILYGIGFMKSYSGYFKPDTIVNILAAERRHSDTPLPLFDEP